jgi:hypothetical protein
MANSKLLKEAIADAKAVKETAIANAKIALEEAFTPKLQSILSKKLQSEMEEEEDDDVEEVAEEVDSSGIGSGDNKEPEYDEAHTELDPETEKETAAPGEELDAVDKVDDLKEEEDKEEVEESTEEVSEEEVKEETEVNEEEDSEEEANEGYHEDDEDEVDEELNLEDIIKELESELSEEEGDEEEVEEGDAGEEEMKHGEDEMAHGEEEMSHGEEEMKHGEDEMDDMDEDIDLDEILKEMGYGEEDGEEEMKDMEESNQVEELSKELEEAYATVKELRGTINEVNLLNAKLLYANKLFRSYAMNNDQKSKVVETLDRTKSVREVKLVFATLAESMKFGGETKRKVRVTEGIASKPQASTAPKKEIISESNEIANRFKKLANIK